MTWKEHKNAMGKEYWEGVLKEADENITEAARIGGVHRPDVYKYMDRYGVTLSRKKFGGNWA
jgi:DNA-binding NtrC family response regulator